MSGDDEKQGRRRHLDLTVKELASSRGEKKPATLYLDKDVYEEAKRIFGKKISAICNSALKDAIAQAKGEKG